MQQIHLRACEKPAFIVIQSYWCITDANIFLFGDDKDLGKLTCQLVMTAS